jgi:type II secretory pathway component GspD/PulD (secretin)
MKNHIIILAAFLTTAAFAADGDINLRFQQASVSQVLQTYSSLTGLELVIAPSATNQTNTITLDINPPVPKQVAVRKIVAALLSQADVVIRPIDAKHLSVKKSEK